jgi:hypothetical protein
MAKEEIKIRCSALGRIMTFDPATQITDNQVIELQGLIDREADPDAKPLTKNMIENKTKLIAKRDAEPALSKGAKTAVEEIYIEDKFAFRKGINSKYIDKGHAMEDSAIDLVSEMLGLDGIKKNETHYENEFLQGTPDAIKNFGMGRGFQFDIKNIYYPDGLLMTKPLEPIYNYQGKGYNWMLGFETGFVVKILQNLPPDLLEGEIKKFWKDAGRDWHEEIPEKFRLEVADYFNFERLPLEDRLRIFRVDVTATDKQEITDAVKLAREHYATLDEVWKNRNVDNLITLKELANG